MNTHPDWLAAQLVPEPPRATSFIVTLYGDLVEPRGGTIWMGSVIDICAAVGLTETHVRTSVSRLVAKGQLEGMKVGRRSYYRLTDPAQREYALGAMKIYAPPIAPPATWAWIAASPNSAEALQRRGFAAVASDIYLGPDCDLADIPVSAIWRAEGSGRDLADFARRHWDIDGAAAIWNEFIDRFGSIDCEKLDGGQSLITRLMLVHDYRFALRADPNLPLLAVGEDWPGMAARRLFARSYSALSPRADQAAVEMLSRLEGPMPQETPATQERVRALGLS